MREMTSPQILGRSNLLLPMSPSRGARVNHFLGLYPKLKELLYIPPIKPYSEHFTSLCEIQPLNTIKIS